MVWWGTCLDIVRQNSLSTPAGCVFSLFLCVFLLRNRRYLWAYMFGLVYYGLVYGTDNK